MVEHQQLELRGITDPRVLQAMRRLSRAEFVPDDLRSRAFEDRPLPIGHGQTISQPYIVALMSELLELEGNEIVLEVGTGSGYQAAVLAELAEDVYSLEIIPALAGESSERLKRLGYANVHVKEGDGYQGWPEAAPFDGIIVTCAPDHVPPPLVEQLKEGGRLVIPMGSWPHHQTLHRFRKRQGRLEKESLIPVAFVPMTGPLKERN
jgi:protein-L-isoaspartate(D-aspartate) O-methyltransferase